MIPLEQRAEMRRLYYAEHWTAGTIASALGVHRDAVLNAIESERFQMRGGRPRVSGLDLYLPFISGVLEQYPRLRATRLYEMLHDRGYSGRWCNCVAWWRSFARRRRRKPICVFRSYLESKHRWIGAHSARLK